MAGQNCKFARLLVMEGRRRKKNNEEHLAADSRGKLWLPTQTFQKVRMVCGYESKLLNCGEASLLACVNLISLLSSGVQRRESLRWGITAAHCMPREGKVHCHPCKLRSLRELMILSHPLKGTHHHSLVSVTLYVLLQLYDLTLNNLLACSSATRNSIRVTTFKSNF